MTEFVFIRHGETEYTAQDRVAGSTDIPLNENGKRATQRAVDRLATEQTFDLCIGSGMLRTTYLVECFRRQYTDTPIFFDTRFREKNNGILEGAYGDDLRRVGLFKYFLEDVWLGRAPNGESTSEVWSRVSTAIKDWAALFPRAKILVASHTETLRTIRAFKTICKTNEVTDWLPTIVIPDEHLIIKIPYLHQEVVSYNP